MKEDVCPISFEDKDNIWSSIEKFIIDRLPLKDVTWKNPVSSSFINIEKLPLRFLSSSAKLFNETQHPYRRFLAPYVHIYVLSAESMDAYKANKSFVKKWLEPINNIKLGKHPWVIVYVPQWTATTEVYQKIFTKLCSDFYGDKIGDHSVMLTIPSDGKRIAPERTGQPSSNQQAFAALADLLGKLRDGVIASFLTRCALYESDIKRLEIYKGTAQFDFWQLFLVKESFALMYQMMQMPDRSLTLYEELEILLVSAPIQSLPVNDWPLVIDPNSNMSANHTPIKAVKSSSSGTSNKDTTTTSQTAATPECAMFADSDESGGPRSTGEISTSTPIKTKSRGGSDSKGDLLSDSHRIGEDVLFYSINQARMSILWNKFSLFQLQHYIFVRQMYFLLVHLRQPIRCAEKALSYILSSSISIEKFLTIKYGSMPSRGNSNSPLTNESDSILKPDDGNYESFRLFELRKMQANTWIVVASLKLIRECRALTQLMVGDAVANNMTSNSYSLPSSINLNSDSIEDNLAAISNTSTHGNSIVYLSIAELSRSQHGIRYSPHLKKQGVAAANRCLESSPATILREALFSPQLEIETALKDSSKILTELLEFALKKLHNLSSNFGIKQIEQQAIELTLSVTKFRSIDINLPYTNTSVEESMTQNSVLVEDSSFSDSNGGSVRRTVTKINNSIQNHLTGNVNNTPVKGRLSSANEDVVLNLEQELDLLEDQSLEVGDRMDQLIVSLSNKIRSTSHYWSKLHEVANLSTETPVKLNDENVGEDPTTFSVNKLKHMSSNKPATLSKSQIQRGHLLELCLFTIGSIVQWHFNLIAGRTRFAVNFIIRCADLLICHDFFHLAAKRLEYILQSGLIAPDNSLQSLNGAWLDIWHWTLRKLLYCAQRNRSVEHYRIIAANILIPTIYNESSRLRPSDILTSLLDEVVYLSTGRLNQPRTSISATNMHPCISILRLPLVNYFDFSIKCIQSNLIPVEHLQDNTHCLDHSCSIKGYRMMNDDLYPTTIFQCVAGSNFTYKLDLRIYSKLPNDITVDQIVIVYKLMNPVSFSPFRNNTVNIPLDVTLLDSLSIASDEIACISNKCHADVQIVIKPGEGLYTLTFKPVSLGDFVIDRFIIVVGTLHFEAHLIPTNMNLTTTSSIVPRNLFNIESPADDEIDNDRLTLNLNTEGTKFTSMLRYYFLHYTGIQVIPPLNVLKTQLSMAPKLYVDMLDDIHLIISTDTKDDFESLEISLHDQINSEQLGENSPDSTFITEELASPVLRRKKMNQEKFSSEKDEDDIAMANAADALAKLLQQNDIDLMNNNYYNKYDKSLRSFCLEIQNSKDWKASQKNEIDTQLYAAERLINFINQSPNSVTFEHISKTKQLFIRVPVKVMKSEFSKDQSLHGEVRLVIDIRGTLLRGDCIIPIKYSKEIVILVGPSIHVEVDSVIEMLPNSQNDLPVILMQSYLRNISTEPIEIVGYNISSIDLTSMDQQLLKVLEGPKDLDLISSSPSRREEEEVFTQKKILLHSHEEYLIGILFELGSYSYNKSEFKLEFQYQRLQHCSYHSNYDLSVHNNTALLDDCCSDDVINCIPNVLRIHRIFTTLACKVHFSSTMKTLPKQQLGVEFSNETTSTILDCNRIQHHLSIQSTILNSKDYMNTHKITLGDNTCNSAIPNVVLGNILHCEYVLDIYYLEESTKGVNDSSYSKNMRTEFSVQIYECRGWTPVGQSSYRSLLHFDTTTTDNTETPVLYKENPLLNWNKIQYIFQLHILSNRLGIYPLPPLHVEYHNISCASEHINDNDYKNSFTIYPDNSTGIKPVMILPVGSTINDETNELYMPLLQQQDISMNNDEILRTICIGL